MIDKVKITIEFYNLIAQQDVECVTEIPPYQLELIYAMNHREVLAVCAMDYFTKKDPSIGKLQKRYGLTRDEARTIYKKNKHLKSSMV